MKTDKIGWYMLFSGILLLVLGIVFGSALAEGLKEAYGDASVEKLIVEVKPEWKGGDKNIFTADKMKKLKGRLLNKSISYTVLPESVQQSIKYGDTSTQASICGIGDSYTGFHRLTFVYGSLSPAFFKSLGSNKALVSDHLAWKLFKTTNATGQTFRIFGEAFTIVGVFEPEKSILHSWSEAKPPDILIPAETLLHLDSNAYIDSFEIATGKNEYHGSEKNVVVTALRQLDIDESALNITDVEAAQEQIQQYPMMIIFSVGIFTILVQGLHFVAAFREITGSIRQITQEHGFFNALWQSIGSAWLQLLLPAGIITILFLAVKSIGFDFKIKPEYISGEDLDLRKYGKLFEETLQHFLAGVSDEASSGVRLLQAARLLAAVTFSICLPGGLFLSWIGMHFIEQRNMDTGGIIWKAGMGFILCLAACAGLCIACGLPLSINITGILILWCFLGQGDRFLVPFWKWDKEPVPLSQRKDVFIG